jgi:hypothetical protein
MMTSDANAAAAIAPITSRRLEVLTTVGASVFINCDYGVVFDRE